MSKYETASITAQNTGTSEVDCYSAVGVSISGTWVATVWLQRRWDGTNWRDVKSYTANVEETLSDPIGSQYRLFVKTGGFTSGTIVCTVASK